MKRLMTSACYILVMLVFIFLKILLPDPWGWMAFDALVYIISIVGTMEIVQAFGERLTQAERDFALIFSWVFFPLLEILTVLFSLAFPNASPLLFALAIAGIALLFAFLYLSVTFVVYAKETSIESLGCALFICFYPTILLMAYFLCNHMRELSDLAILLVIVIPPCSDAIAYVAGMALRNRFPKKLAPEISPNKTVIGALGGLFGGWLGVTVLYFLYTGFTGGAFDFKLMPLFWIAGFFGSIATAFGDLVESAIKRKVGIKDMGDLLPGHGGILDRMDGSIYAAFVVLIVMEIYLLFV